MAESLFLGSLDLRTLRVRIDTEDGDPVIVLDDGEVCMTFVPGAGGSRAQVVLGAERLASAAREYAEAARAEVLSTGTRAGNAPVESTGR